MDVSYFAYPDVELASLVRGQFAKRILILCTAEAERPDMQAFLTKVMGAAQVDLAQDTLWAALPATNTSWALTPLLKAKQPATVLVFGLTPAQLGWTMDVDHYQPTEVRGVSFLWAEALSTLEPDRNRKLQLWQVLKTMKF